MAPVSNRPRSPSVDRSNLPLPNESEALVDLLNWNQKPTGSNLAAISGSILLASTDDLGSCFC
jgi:hypothetical protein